MESLEGVLAIVFKTNRRMIPRVQLSISFVSLKAKSVRKIHINNNSYFKDFGCILFLLLAFS